jgi:hypothetical protein
MIRSPGMSIYASAASYTCAAGIVAKKIGVDDAEFNYLVQKHGGGAIPLGQALQDHAFEWAWKKGKASFPKEYFETEVHRSCFLKHLACDAIASIQPTANADMPASELVVPLNIESCGKDAADTMNQTAQAINKPLKG